MSPFDSAVLYMNWCHVLSTLFISFPLQIDIDTVCRKYLKILIKGKKGKVVPKLIKYNAMNTYGGVKVFLTSALDGGEWSALRPGKITPPPCTHWIGGTIIIIILCIYGSCSTRTSLLLPSIQISEFNYLVILIY
jgi:hypothetical protein